MVTWPEPDEAEGADDPEDEPEDPEEEPDDVPEVDEPDPEAAVPPDAVEELGEPAVPEDDELVFAACSVVSCAATPMRPPVAATAAAANHPVVRRTESTARSRPRAASCWLGELRSRRFALLMRPVSGRGLRRT